MFAQRKSKIVEVDTLIGKNSHFYGNIEVNGIVKIDGALHGNITATGDVIIGDGAVVNGDIVCQNIIISGSVKGNISAKEQMRFTSSSQIIGDIKMLSLIMDEGAVFNGSCGMADVVEAQSDSDL